MQKEKQILTADLRNTLKNIIDKEIKKLPSTLETLEPKDRLNILCKLMPYVFPKTESVMYDLGEPDEFVINSYYEK